ncbi:hypothetical protein L2E82_43211 [Cichorium intybus]|uniref:Uncharacterized protein n=1 Tax=Cichorium intybus TaxID=13427 RepID=A0ACB8ZP97_CICIN|nr:hypothetical protein L2E82_43211 [Cichorium intybus]
MEAYIECSAANLSRVIPFSYAFREVRFRNLVSLFTFGLFILGPLVDQGSQGLKSRCIRALKRIFSHCDQNMDSALNDTESNEFLVRCFNDSLQLSEIVNIKRDVKENVREGVNDVELTLPGFLLQEMFMEKGHFETPWIVLRKFGYNDDIELRKENLPVPSKKAPDQSIELTSEAVDFLIGIFSFFDSNNSKSSYEVKIYIND